VEYLILTYNIFILNSAEQTGKMKLQLLSPYRRVQINNTNTKI